MNHDVFISYSSQDKEAAQAICHVLEQNEIRCWMAPRDVPYGSQYGDVIDDAIKSCKVTVVLFSETAAASQWVNGEMNVAFEEEKTIIPFRLDQTPLKGQTRVMLNQRHWIDAYPDYKTKFNDLVSAVAHSMGKKVEPEPKAKLKPEPTPFTKYGLLKKYLKHLIVGVLSAIFIALIFVLSPLISRQLHIYTYDKQGLHVSVKGLSSEQENALTSILDDMVLIEGGTFLMGNLEGKEDFLIDQDSLSNNVHWVKLSNYYMSNCEVTQKIWQSFASLDGHYIEYGENKAIDVLSYEEAVAFVDSLSHLTGIAFSLPTEAQWEFAARGGREWKTNNHIYSGSNDAREVGWTSYDGLTSAHIVKSGKEKNELGLYDMTGNVSEWCLDYYARYDTAFVINPKGPSEGFDRVFRGGDFNMNDLVDLKVTTRYSAAPFVPRKATGLRLVINL